MAGRTRLIAGLGVGCCRGVCRLCVGGREEEGGARLGVERRECDEGDMVDTPPRCVEL